MKVCWRWPTLSEEMRLSLIAQNACHAEFNLANRGYPQADN